MGGLFDKLERELKFKLSDTTLTSDVNQTLSNLLSQTNKVKKTVAEVSTVATRANVQSTNPSLALENLTDVIITAVKNGQTIQWNGTDWVNGQAGAAFNVSGQGWFAGPGMDASAFINNANSFLSAGGGSGPGANHVVVCQFVLESSWTLSKVSYKVQTTSASTNFNFGIYDVNGNKLIDSGAFDGSISTLQTNTFTTTTLAPGVYYFAFSATSTLITGPCININQSDTPNLFAMVGSLWANATNLTSGNVMPSTLGALSSPLSSNIVGIPSPIWKV